MSPVYLTATRLRELGADHLALRLLCALHETPGFRGHPSVLWENLGTIRLEADLRARVADSAEVAVLDGALSDALAAVTADYLAGGDEDALLEGWRAETLKRIGDAPYRLGSPLVQLPFPARTAVEVLSLVFGARRKLAGLPPEPDLVEAPGPPDDAVSFGAGETPIIVVGDPQDDRLPRMLEAAAALIAPQATQVRWVWMHAPRSETPQAVLQAFHRQEQLARLRNVPVEVVAAVLREPVPSVAPPLYYPDDPRTDGVLRQLAILDTCGVPRSRRPALVVGKTVHLESPGPDFAAAVRAAVSHG